MFLFRAPDATMMSPMCLRAVILGNVRLFLRINVLKLEMAILILIFGHQIVELDSGVFENRTTVTSCFSPPTIFFDWSERVKSFSLVRSNRL